MHVPIEIFMVHSYNKQQNENLHLNDYHLCHGQQVLGKKSKQAESECPLQQDVTEVNNRSQNFMRGRNMYVYKLGLTKRSTINNSWITVSLEINSICNIQKQ